MNPVPLCSPFYAQAASGIGSFCCRGWVLNRRCLDAEVDV